MHERQDLPILWTVSQVAKYLGVSRITVYRWIEEKRVLRPSDILRLGKRVRIRREAIELLVREMQESLKEE